MRKLLMCSISEMYFESFLCNIVEMDIFDDLNSFFKNFIISSYIFVLSSALFDSKLLIPTFINIFSGALILAFSNFSLMSIMFGVKICWHFFSLFKSSGFRNFPLESKNISTLPEISSDFFVPSAGGISWVLLCDVDFIIFPEFYRHIFPVCRAALQRLGIACLNLPCFLVFISQSH